MGPNAPKFLPSHLPTAPETYSTWLDSLSENCAGCFASGQVDALWGTSSDTCSHEHDSISQWESCSDNSSDTCSHEHDSTNHWESCSDTSSDCGTTPTISSVESQLFAPSTSWLPSATPGYSASRLFLPYPPSSLPCTVASWWQDHQYIIIDSIFFHGYKCHPLDIEHWLGLSVNSCGSTFDSTYLQLCEERVSFLCDYLFIDTSVLDGNDNWVVSRGYVYSQYLVELLNALLCHLLSMHKLRLACWPSPRSFSSEDDSHISPYCLSFSTPHTLPPTYPTPDDPDSGKNWYRTPDDYYCNEYNAEWRRINHGENWFKTSNLHSVNSTLATSALIARQIRLFGGYGFQFSDRSLFPSPSSTLSQEALLHTDCWIIFYILP